MSTKTKKSKFDIDHVLSSIQLPALPQTAITLLELSQDASNGPAEFARPIEADAGLAGQVLRFVNSSFFGFTAEITNVSQALALVGVRTIKNFVLWNAVFSLVPDPMFGPFNLKNLWQDSLRRAIFSRILGRALQLPNSEELFAAALLQDMAIPLLLKEMPLQYEFLIERQKEENLRLSQAERELFGWDHGEVAAILVRKWRLPEEFATLIERHADVSDLIDASPPALDAACVALAALLPSCRDNCPDERDQFLSALRRLSSSSYDSVAKIVAETDEGFAEFAPIMKLPIPKTTLSDWLAS